MSSEVSHLTSLAVPVFDYKIIYSNSVPNHLPSFPSYFPYNIFYFSRP